jgi:4-hydroxy-3-methylbut-2-en-1-yl diphosphate synthase IspG/GcpE
MVEAYRLMATKVDYPLHLGVTEAGTPFGGTIKSAIGLGASCFTRASATRSVSRLPPNRTRKYASAGRS